MANETAENTILAVRIPSDLRALAFRVETEEPTEELRAAVLTAVRVERLQDISEADACAEGAERMTTDADGKCYLDNSRGTYLTGFCGLWCHLHGVESMHDNPWVSVTTFERIEG